MDAVSSLKDEVNRRVFSRTAPNGECLEFQGARTSCGYGVVGYMGQTMYAHRLAYVAENGDIPPNTYVCHSCDNPSCVNPAHLWLGSPKDNVRDAMQKGRRRTRLTDVPADIAAMFHTHEAAREYGAPDLAESKTFGRDVPSGEASEATLSRASAIAREMTRRLLAEESLRRRPVDGFFVRCGHEKREDTIYRDAKGERCRLCRNARRREARAA